MKEAEEKQARIKPKTYQEYNKWDAFDVDEQLKKLDAKEREEKAKADKEKALEDRKAALEKRRRVKSKKEEAIELKEEGNAAFKQGDLEEALDCYTLSLAADASVFQTYCNRAMVLLRLGRAPDAQADADKAIKLAPKFTKGYMRRGAALEAQDKLEEALAAYEEAKRLEPLNKEARKLIHQVKVGLGLAEPEEEQPKEAKDPYEEMSLDVVDYGSDSDYEEVQGSQGAVEEEEESQQEEGIPAREMPAHLKKKGAMARPKNATQFEQTWTDTLKGDLAGRAALIRAITPVGLGNLLKAGLEADLFTGILEVANGFMLLEEALEVLLALTKTRRFDMNMMMAATGDTKNIKEIIESATAVGDPAQAATLRSLRQKFGAD